jgi:hypothetical protein
MYTLSLSRRISKGDQIFIPIPAINQSRELWGPDAHEFKYVSLAYLVQCVPLPTAGQNGGKTFRRPSRRFQACGATY